MKCGYCLSLLSPEYAPNCPQCGAPRISKVLEQAARTLSPRTIRPDHKLLICPEGPKPKPTPLPPLRRLQPDYKGGRGDRVGDLIIQGGLVVLVALPVLLILNGLGVL